MSDRDSLLAALTPILDVLRAIDVADPDAAARLDRALPIASERVQRVAQLVRAGVTAGWLCDREGGGIRYSRVAKADHPVTSPFSLDAVHMDRPGPGHTHPNGEFDLCFPVSGSPRFDGHAPGWVVYPPGSWHVPTVTGGVMDILYFLPNGAIRFEPRPD